MVMEDTSSNAEGYRRGWMSGSGLPPEIWKKITMPSCPLLLTSTDVPRPATVRSARCWCWVMIVEVEGAEGLEIRGSSEGADRAQN
jgi:hypothetical protein